MTNGIGLILLFEFVLIILSNVYGIFIYIIFSKQYCSFIDVYKIFYGTMWHALYNADNYEGDIMHFATNVV